jgi:hypothetical protein
MNAGRLRAAVALDLQVTAGQDRRVLGAGVSPHDPSTRARALGLLRSRVTRRLWRSIPENPLR